MKIWRRHILGQLTKTFFFLLFCIFTIYIVVDLSVHGVRFLSKSTLWDVARYYIHTFATLLDLFLTLTFLLATMRVLFDLNASRELVALQMAGLSKKKLLSPFFLFACFLSSLCYINSQWLSPDSQDTAYEFKNSHKTKKKKPEKVRVYSCLLQDESELVYQSFDREKNELFDVFWIRTPNDIWHMKYFEINSLQGKFVNHLIRNSAKQFENTESFAVREFTELPWNNDIVLNRFVRFENRPLTTLLSQSFANSAEKASIHTHLYYKMLVPLMPFLVLFAIAPVSIRFARNRPLLLITTAALFGFISLKVILDGMLILGENQVLPALPAIFGPILLLLGFSLPRFARMK